MFTQIGAGSCTLCKSMGTNKSTCPCNPNIKNPNYKNHPNWQDYCPSIGNTTTKQTKVKSPTTLPDNKDNLNSFINELTKNIRHISDITQNRMNIEIDEEDEIMKTGGICWLAADMVETLLVKDFTSDPVFVIIDSHDTDKLLKTIKIAIKQKLYIRVIYDSSDGSQTHHFSSIPMDNDKVAIIEYLQNQCFANQIISTNSFLNLINDISIGNPERFYKHPTSDGNGRTVTIVAMNRLPMNRNTVLNSI
jgi:hypothetical protein